MNKLNISNLSFKIEVDNSLYIILSNDEFSAIKRITNSMDIKTVEIIYIDKNGITTSKTSYKDDKKQTHTLTTHEKDELVEDIFENISKFRTVSEALDINNLKNIIKSSYINIVIANNDIGLSMVNTLTLKNNDYAFDIISLDTKKIIGRITIKSENYIIDAPSDIEESAYMLFKKYLCMFKNEELTTTNKIKKLNNKSNSK